MMSRDQQGVVLFLSLLLTLVFILTSRPFSPPSAGAPRDRLLPPVESPAEGEVWVEVDGPVRNRGIYPLAKGRSVLEAVEKAGGTTDPVSLTPDSAEARIAKSGLLRVSGEGNDKGRASLHPFDPPKMRVLAVPVNVNTAKVEELDILPGLGPKMAQAIVDFRETHGKFSTVEDLQKVKGLGPKKLAAIRPHITLTD